MQTQPITTKAVFGFVSLALLLLSPAALDAATQCTPGSGPVLGHPVLFVTQVPIPTDFATIGSTFANHFSRVSKVGRGGDLYIRYADGTLCNLTREAGFGSAAEDQRGTSIAVRDPSVHWDGDRALFSMVIGAPTRRFEVVTHFWQIYEVTGLGQGEPVTITKIPFQPFDYNNLTPVYSPDGRILFSSDRPRTGERHLYPQLDEYESTPTNTGLWSLDLASGDLRLLDHSPSGVFSPIVDSFGRVIFIRWDHLQRDQQADADAVAGGSNGTFNYADESVGAARLADRTEVFPEPRAARTDLLAGTNLFGHRFNHFFPWQMNADGTELETLNHIGRHELHGFFREVFNDDPSLDEFIAQVSGRFNPNTVESFHHVEEDAADPGVYFMTAAPEFGTHASGMIVSLTGAPVLPADQMAVTYITHPDTLVTMGDGGTAPANHSGHYRDPLPMSGGELVASHTDETRAAGNDGSRQFPLPRYDFRLRRLDFNAVLGHHVAGSALTSGISRRINYWDPDELVTWDGPLWELQAAEVRTRPQPAVLTTPLPSTEGQVFSNEGIDVAAFQEFLRRDGLALVVSRDVTTRDAADVQQPFNLKIAGSSTQTTGDGGQLYEVAYLQFFQGDLIRGMGGTASPDAGRRVLAQPMHGLAFPNPPAPAGPPGSVALGADGSMAALVPANRAMSWQLTAADGTPVVRERYWVTFQAGEIRVCASCHGLNSEDQAGQAVPVQEPVALRTLLQHWSGIFSDGFESGKVAVWSSSVGQ